MVQTDTEKVKAVRTVLREPGLCSPDALEDIRRIIGRANVPNRRPGTVGKAE